MPFYQKRGKIPSKRHTQFQNENGDLYWEELISRGGFATYTLMFIISTHLLQLKKSEILKYLNYRSNFKPTAPTIFILLN